MCSEAAVISIWLLSKIEAFQNGIHILSNSVILLPRNSKLDDSYKKESNCITIPHCTVLLLLRWCKSLVPGVVLIPLRIATKLSMTKSENILEN